MTLLHKGGETDILNSYRPISKLSCLAKILESLVNDQLKSFLSAHSILCTHQSGFTEKHRTITVATLVLNDVISALDNKKHCAALFIDLSEAFDTVDHTLLLKKLLNIGFDDVAFNWFQRYLMDRQQFMSNLNLFRLQKMLRKAQSLDLYFLLCT